MDASNNADRCLILNVGVVARGARCLTIMQTLHDFKPSQMRLKLVAIAATTRSAAAISMPV